MFEGKVELDKKGRDVCVCVCVCEGDSVRGAVCKGECMFVRVRVHKHQPVCSTENRSRQHMQAASVADELHGLAGTSGAQVALSIQDRAHWSVVWQGAGANSWTLALSAPRWGGRRRAEVGKRLTDYGWRHPQTLLDLRAQRCTCTNSIDSLPQHGRLSRLGLSRSCNF